MVSPTKVDVPVDVEVFLTINGQAIQLVNGPKPDPNKLPPVAMTPANQAAILDALRAMRGVLLMFSGVYKVGTQQISLTPWHDAEMRGRVERISRGITAAGLDNETTTRQQLDDKLNEELIRPGMVDFVRDQPAPQVEGVDWSPVKQSATPLCDGPQQDYPPGSIPVDGLDERLLALLKRVKQYSNTATQHGCRVDFAYDEAMWHGMTSLDDMTHGPTPGRIYHNSKTGKTWFIPDKPAPVTKGPTISGAQ